MRRTRRRGNEVRLDIITIASCHEGWSALVWGRSLFLFYTICFWLLLLMLLFEVAMLNNTYIISVAEMRYGHLRLNGLEIYLVILIFLMK